MEQEKNTFWRDLIHLFASIIMEPIIGEILKTLKFPPSVIKTAFYIVLAWIFIALFLLVRNTLVRFRDKKQSPYIFSIPISYDGRAHKKIISDETFYSFKWMLHVSHPPRKNNARQMKIEDVFGPFCPHDECEMNEEKTYFGRYRYECPK